MSKTLTNNRSSVVSLALSVVVFALWIISTFSPLNAAAHGNAINAEISKLLSEQYKVELKYIAMMDEIYADITDNTAKMETIVVTNTKQQ